MQASRSSAVTRVFVLRKEDLRTFVSVLSQDLPEIKFSMKCTDAITRHCDTLDELERYPNPERAAISELRIRATDSSRQQTASFVFDSDKRGNVVLNLDGEVELVTKINTFWEDSLAGHRPWYSWVSIAPWKLLTWVGWLLFSLVSVALMVYRAREGAHGLGTLKAGLPADLWVKAIILGAIPSIAEHVIEKIRAVYFPTGAFALGDGLNRYNNRENMRTVVIFGFAISIITTVVLSWVI